MGSTEATAGAVWTRGVALASAFGIGGGTITFHLAANNVSSAWDIFFQVLLVVMMAACLVGAAGRSATWRARSMGFVTGSGLAVAALALLSIGIVLLIAVAMIAAATAREARTAGKDNLRLIAGGFGVALPWLGFIAFRP